MVDRRSILKGLTAIPILGVLGGAGAALLSYLKPTLKPLALPTTEKPLNKPFAAVRLEELKEPWAVKEFVFTQETVEYSARGKQSSQIPGFILRIPNGVIDPMTVGDAGHNHLRRGYGVFESGGQTYSLVAISRICPHLGCIFQYHTPQEVCTGFNYCGEAQKGAAGHNLFSCPCHLSVYNPLEIQDANGIPLPGRVVSGPAPRPPFPFEFALRDGQVVIESY